MDIQKNSDERTLQEFTKAVTEGDERLLESVLHSRDPFGKYRDMVLNTFLLAGYVILMEEDVWLKATAVKVVSIMTVFSLILAALSIVPDAIGLLNYFVALFGGSFSVLLLTNLVYFLQQFVTLAETVVFLLLALKALKMDTINVPMVDMLITKHMD